MDRFYIRGFGPPPLWRVYDRNMPEKIVASCWDNDDAAVIANALNNLVHRKPPASALLTPREIDVARQLITGAPDKIIAHQLGIAEGTAKVFVQRIRRRLGVRNRASAILKLLEMDLG